VHEAVLYCSESERDILLYYILAVHSGRTLVFVNAISAVRRLAAVLRTLGLPASPLHSSMQQRQRLKALDRFRKNPDAILVATDVAARGLDIAVRFCSVSSALALLVVPLIS
jgi:ATP-dependent RNA helicase DDX24/MAK5